MDLPDKQNPPQAKKDFQPVVSQPAVQAPRPATQRFMHFLFAESPKALGAKIGRDVVVPRLKAAGEEALNSFLHGMLWGNGGKPLSNIAQGTVLRAGGTQYHNISSLPQTAPAPTPQQQTSSGNYQDLICPTQQDAENLLASMYGALNQYRVVAVADLYEMARIKPAPSDNAFGWYSLDGARISKVREGYQLELPKPTAI